MSQINELKQRVSGLEDQLSRVMRILVGMAEMVPLAAKAPSVCAICGLDPEVVASCGKGDGCPQGKG